MTPARIQPNCRKHNIEIGYYDGFRVYPRNNTERNIALKIHNNHFYLFWKSNGIFFDRATKNLKDNLKVIDNVISDKHVKSYIKYEYKPKKAQSHITKVVVCDIETFNTDKAVPCASCLYRIDKISGKYNGDITQRE